MSFTLSGTTITQSGTDTPSTVISGLSAISGVVATSFNTYTKLTIPYKLVINGSMTTNRTVKFSFTRGGFFENEITINSTGSLICKDVRNENGYNYYYELPSMDFNNPPIGGWNSSTRNAIIVNGGTLDLANITINADGGQWWNGGTIKFRDVTLNAQGVPSTGDTQFTSQGGNPNIDIIGLNIIGGRVFLGSGTLINFKEFKPQFMQRGFGTWLNNFVVNDFIGGFGNIGDVSLYNPLPEITYEYRNPNLGTGIIFKTWLYTDRRANGTIKITSDLTITLKDNLGNNVNSFIGYLKDNATGAPTGFTNQITYIQTAVNNVMSANVLIGVLFDATSDTAFIKRSTSQTNDEYAFTLFSYSTNITTTSALNLAGIGTKSFNAIATVDTNVTLTEANAIAKLASSFSVNTATNTITVTANSTLDDLYDAMKVYKTRNVQAQLEYPTISTQPVTASGDTLVTAMSVVGLEFLTAGTKFKKIQANGTASGAMSNLTVNGNVTQATPTNLSNVTITGTLTYSTNSNVTITITNSTIDTVVNNGTGIVTINRVNSTIANYVDAEINFIDSTISVIGADTITFHPTATDRDLNINASGSFTSSYAFKFGSVVNGSTMSGTLYLRCVAGGIPFDINKTIVLGDNLVDLGPTAQLVSLAAKIDLTAKEATLLQTEADIINAIGSGGGGHGGGGGGLTLAQIEASTVLAKEATVASRSSQASVNAIPTNPVLANDARLNNLDTPISTRSTLTAPQVRNELATELSRLDVAISTRLAASAYIAPDNANIQAIKTKVDTLNNYNDATLQSRVDAIKAKTDQLIFTAGNVNAIAQVVSDKTGYSLTTAEITAIAVAVEQAILNESDGQAILNAIVGAIGNQNIDQLALVAAIRADIERSGGMLESLPTIDEINSSATLAKTSDVIASKNEVISEINANELKIDAIKVDVEALENADFTITNNKIDAVKTKVDTLENTDLTGIATTTDVTTAKDNILTAINDIPETDLTLVAKESTVQKIKQNTDFIPATL